MMVKQHMPRTVRETVISGGKRYGILQVHAAVLAAAAMMFLSASPVSFSGEDLRRFYALCVGLAYPGAGHKLNYTTRDAGMIAEAFERASGFGPEASRIELLVDDDPGLDVKPTPAEIRRRLRSIAGEAREGDRIVFYFSGHGALDENGRSILICHGGKDRLDSNAHLLLSDARDILSSSRAEWKLAIIDACHSGGKTVGDDEVTPEGIKKAFGPAAGSKGVGAGTLAWLSSSDAGQESYEYAEQRQGLFTHFLLETIGEKAEIADTDMDGMLSAAEIHRDVSNRIAAFILAEDEKSGYSVWRGRIQTPRAGIGGELALNPIDTDLKRLNLFYVGRSPSSSPSRDGSGSPSRAESGEISRDTRLMRFFIEFELAAESGDHAEAVKIAEERLLPLRDRADFPPELGYLYAVSLRKAGQVQKAETVIADYLENPSLDRDVVRAALKLRMEIEEELANAPLDCGGGVMLELARIPAGTFMMGSPKSEEGRFDDEVQHQVWIGRDFNMGAYEVTQAQYQAVMGANPSDEFPGAFPVKNVSWKDAVEFCRKLSEKTGRTVRLPTEAEWEYACRAGTTTAYYSGDDPETLARVGNVADAELKKEEPSLSASMISASDGYGMTTAAVGRFQPNRWGLYDMHGNVQEWCSDEYGEQDQSYMTSQGTSITIIAPRVVRGGSWIDGPRSCRSAARLLDDPFNSNSYLGFRIALDN